MTHESTSTTKSQIKQQPVARIATVVIENFPNGYTIRVTDNHGTEYRIDLRAALVGKKITSTRMARRYEHITAIKD